MNNKEWNFRVSQKDCLCTCYVKVHLSSSPHSYSAGGKAGGAVDEFPHLKM